MQSGSQRPALPSRALRNGGVILVTLIVVFAFILIVKPAQALNTQAKAPIYYDKLPAKTPGSAPYVIGAKWDKTTVTYSIRNCPRSLDCTVAAQAAREGVEYWDTNSGMTLNEVTGDADINIWWYAGNHGDGSFFDGPSGILAHAFFPIPWLGALAGDAHFDDDETWVYWWPTQGHEIHLPTVIGHEIGHSLGLEHSGDPGALMWAQYVGVRGLSSDDIAGIQALYGAPNGNDTPAVPTAAPGGGGGALTPSGVNATATTTIKMRSGPSTAFGQVGLFTYQAVAPIYGKNTTGDWFYIQYNGVFGWVAARYTRLSGGSQDQIPVVSDNPGGVPPTPAPDLPSTGVTATTTSPTRMRSGPGTTFSVVTTIAWGDTVPIFAKNAAGDWIYVEWQGKRGWIAAWLVNITGDLSTVPVQ